MAFRDLPLENKLFFSIVALTCLTSTLMFVALDDSNVRQKTMTGSTRWLRFQELSGAHSGAVNKSGTIRVLLLRNQNNSHGAPLLQSTHISPDKNCVFHTDRGLLNVSDAVIMKSELLMDQNNEDIPERYSPTQKWVFYVWEVAKSHFLMKHTGYEHKFNITMTYSNDSDIYYPYGECVKQKMPKFKVHKRMNLYLRNKDRLVSWMVSDCGSMGRREEYVRALLRHIPIDVYGDCGNRTCVRNRSCNFHLSRYKFYLAFENSLCDEYITEKLWKTLEFHIVPVVYGALEAYRSVLPPHSFIAVSDFTSPQHLASYLQLLNDHPTLYRRYFEWRYNYKCKHITIDVKSRRVCEYLHRHNGETQDALVLNEAWINQSSKCQNASAYLTKLGVSHIEKRPFAKEDCYIYDNLHKQADRRTDWNALIRETISIHKEIVMLNSSPINIRKLSQ